MTSQTFLKLTTLLSAFVFLSGIAMEPQKRSMEDVYAEIRNNLNNYSNTYKWDIIDFKNSVKATQFANTVSILEQMGDNIAKYNQNDINNFLSLIQSHTETLYINELLGLNPFGTLAKHKKILCLIKAHCEEKLENTAHHVADEPNITKKSRSIKSTPENIPVEKKQNSERINALEKEIQPKINVIARARILGDLKHKNVPLDVSTESLNKAGRIWSEELFEALKIAIKTDNEAHLKRLWQANFNDNHTHFKAREKQLHTLIIQRLEKDNVHISKIQWFKKHTMSLVRKKEVQFTLKSEPKRPETIVIVEPVKTTTTIKPQGNISAPGITASLKILKWANDYDGIIEQLKKISRIQPTNTLTTSEYSVIKNEIDETINYVYQHCMLGLYENNEQRPEENNQQKLQLDIFDICSDELIALGTRLRKELKESNQEITTYVNNAHKKKQTCLYEIKVIRSSEKIATEEDIATWKTITQGKLSADIEARDTSAVQKTIRANFDTRNTPLLAENHNNIINNVKNMFNGGKDKANSTWINEHEFLFTQPRVIPNRPAEQSFLQTCKNNWILSSLGVAVIITGIYYLWEECTTENEDDLSAEGSDVAEAKTDVLANEETLTKEQNIEKEDQAATDTNKNTRKKVTRNQNTKS